MDVLRKCPDLSYQYIWSTEPRMEGLKRDSFRSLPDSLTTESFFRDTFGVQLKQFLHRYLEDFRKLKR